SDWTARASRPRTAEHQLGADSFSGASEGSLGNPSVGMRPVIDVPVPGAACFDRADVIRVLAQIEVR
ncbi:MAG: hypothetical protein ACRDV2_13340, partial [Actinomycetes bacterium]